MTKKYVRKIKSFNDDWNNIRLDVMCKALKAKFSIPEMRNALLLTDGYELEESNWWGDTYWGTYNGVGHNNLGKLLMKFSKVIMTNTIIGATICVSPPIRLLKLIAVGKQ